MYGNCLGSAIGTETRVETAWFSGAAVPGHIISIESSTPKVVIPFLDRSSSKTFAYSSLRVLGLSDATKPQRLILAAPSSVTLPPP